MDEIKIIEDIDSLYKCCPKCGSLDWAYDAYEDRYICLDLTCLYEWIEIKNTEDTDEG